MPEVSADIDNFLRAADNPEARERLGVSSVERVAALEAINRQINIQQVYSSGSYTWETAILAAYNYGVSIKGGEIIFPNGYYDLTGTFVPTHSNGVPHFAQISLPAVTDGAASGDIIFRGESGGSMTTNEFTGGIPNPEQGAIIRGRLIPGSPGYQYSLIGTQGTTSGSFGPWNWQHVKFKDLTFRCQSQVASVEVDPGITCLDFSRLAMVDLENIRVDVDSVAGTQISPMGGSSNGIRMPDSTNWITNTAKNVMIRGFRTGINFAEHFIGDRLLVSGCGIAMHAQGSHHPMWLRNCHINWCRTVLQCTGSPVIYGNLEIENYSPGDRWYQAATHITANGSATPRGRLHYSCGQSAGGYPTPSLTFSALLDMGLLQMVNLRDPYGMESWVDAAANVTLNILHPVRPLRLTNAGTGNVTVPHLAPLTQIKVRNVGAGTKTLVGFDADVKFSVPSGKLAIPQGESRIIRFIEKIGAETFVDVIE